MDVAEIEENLYSIGDAKLHGEMCRTFSTIYCKVLSIFPTLEAARPGSRSGIQALCSLHIALEKAKNILQHCSDCSKLYLAITADSVLLKFDKAKSALIDSLKRVEDTVPQSIGSQTREIVCELEGTVFSLDPSEKQIGDDIIGLLQLGGKFDSCTDNNELESFHQAVTKLGINSSRAALTERRALKKLIEKARVEEDKRKESIVAYLLHLMRKYSKLFRTEIADDNDSQGSAPCSPTVQGSLEHEGHGQGCRAFDRQLSKLSSFNFKPHNKRSWHMPLPPEELRCPISLQLMYDPVIIASGQTYERLCIEKWFSDGHSTCPKTQQKLPHLCLTPNYCVKGLVASWCEQNGVPVPGSPPESLDLNYWRLALSESDSTNSRSMESVVSGQSKEAKAVPLQNHIIEEAEGNETEITSFLSEDSDNLFERYQDLLHILDGEEDLIKKSKVVEHIRFMLKDDEEARNFMGANGFIGVLLRYLELALHEKNVAAQESGAMALFNLAVNNNRNKEMMLEAGVATLLERMIQNSGSHGPATALYLNLTCHEEAKRVIGSSQAVPFLIQKLQADSEQQIKQDALHALYNLSTYPPNISNLLEAGIISTLHSVLAVPCDNSCTEKCIAVLINLAASQSGKDEMVSSSSLISLLASILDVGEPTEQEQAVSCLLILCNASEKCSQLVLLEGVIPALVSISVSGTTKGIEKSQKLLMLFRQQRQRDQSFADSHQQNETSDDFTPQSKAQTRSYSRSGTKAENGDMGMSDPESKPFCKSASKRKMGRALSFLWKSKSYSVYQC